MKAMDSRYGPLLVALGLIACGGGKGRPKEAPAPAAQCPPGQTYDGQFCQVTGAPAPEQATTTQPERRSSEPGSLPTVESASGGALAGAAPASGSGGGVGADVDVQPAAGGGALAAPAAPRAPSIASPVDVSMAAQAGPLITYMASSHLPPGARPVGNPFAAQFTEGQVFEQQVKLAPGKCYTVVAAGLPPVAEVHVALYAGSTTARQAAGAVPPVPLARDQGSGPQGVLGSRDACYKPTASEAWLVIQVTKGQGVVAGQLFQK